MAVDGETQLVGIVGWPVAHSLSPAMHNAAFAAAGMNWSYVPLPVPPHRLQPALRGLRGLGFRGANITVPHKESVLPLLDEVDEDARIIGAVNTVLIDEESDGRLVGYNTDWRGFLADLQSLRVAVAEHPCLILGAGGAARAVAYALLKAGAHVYVLARRETQARQLARAIGATGGAIEAVTPAALKKLSTTWQQPLLVNATPAGMRPNVAASPWPSSLSWPAACMAYDLIYDPPQTTFMRQAIAAGGTAANGQGMLLWQGVYAFEIWTGRRPDVDSMRLALGQETPGAQERGQGNST